MSGAGMDLRPRKDSATDEASGHCGSVALLTWSLAACSKVGPFATDMYLPSFHDMAATFGVGLDLIQLTLSGYLAGAALATLFCGAVSDAIGPRAT